MKKLTVLHRATTSLVIVTMVIISALWPVVLAADSPPEFSLPLTEVEMEGWHVLAGVGAILHYPPEWQGRPYQAQGGVRDSATYELVWSDERGVAARIEILEIVNPETPGR